MAVELRPWQKEALPKISNGKILKGGVGSGKSVVAFAYIMHCGLTCPIYVITTAKKRDSLEWEGDAAKFGIGRSEDTTVAGVLHIDSWNNIDKYVDVRGAFFIFDEQRLVGSGAWVKAFYKIAKQNQWIILSATPGDTWMDYIPVFVANGYYKNITEFKREHVVYARWNNRFPQIDRFIGLDKLQRQKKEVLVEMPYTSANTRHEKTIMVEYDKDLFKLVYVNRWNPYTEEPIRDVAELFAVMRRVVYSDPSRIKALQDLMKKHPKIIVFYNFNYELKMLRELDDSWSDVFQIGEWNGHRKTPIPDSEHWLYLVQYTAGAEGWNCRETDTMNFFSLPYSYKKFEQSHGRIDRVNNYFSDLYYYSFFTTNIVDISVKSSLDRKKTFNESRWAADNGIDFE